MKTGARLLILILVVMFAACTVQAATAATDMQGFATIGSDGGCQVSLALTLHIEEAGTSLRFPVPADATGISVNGSRVAASRSGDVKNINLSRVFGKMVGDFSVNIQYSLRDVITTTEEGTLLLQLPMLSGFSHQIEKMSFSVTLPGAVETLPGFTSGYHQAGIEEDITYTISGNTITGQSKKALKDHETLTMTLSVTEQMFPRNLVQSQNAGTAAVGMGICGGLALLYWLFFLWNLPVIPWQNSMPVTGFGAGTLGCILTRSGVDLSMMVMSWAQLGYVLIQPGSRGVTVHKRMEMGNERPETERRCFQKLFGKKNSISTRDLRYAQLVRALKKKPMGVEELLKKTGGNRMVFLILSALIGLFGGIGIGATMGAGAALQGLLEILMAALGGLSGWVLTQWGCGLILGQRKIIVATLLVNVAWLILSAFAGVFALGLGMCLGLLAAAILYAWGGKRTALGRQAMRQSFGFARYLKKMPKKQLQQMQDVDPDFFFRYAPYAIALGVDRAFAAKFGKTKLSGCPYFADRLDAQMTASQWNEKIHATLESMDHRANYLPYEKWISLIQSMIKP